jgi:hypothetical protein
VRKGLVTDSATIYYLNVQFLSKHNEIYKETRMYGHTLLKTKAQAIKNIGNNQMLNVGQRHQNTFSLCLRAKAKHKGKKKTLITERTWEILKYVEINTSPKNHNSSKEKHKGNLEIFEMNKNECII